MPLTDQQVQMLTFERQWWRWQGAREAAIRRQFEMSPTRYFQLLNALLDDPAAEAEDPVTVRRLRRIRDEARRARAGR